MPFIPKVLVLALQQRDVELLFKLDAKYSNIVVHLDLRLFHNEAVLIWNSYMTSSGPG